MPGFVIFGGQERKAVEVRVVNEESCCGSSRSTALGGIAKLRCSVLGASFSIFAVFSILAFSFALLSFLSFALGCIGSSE